MAHPMPQPAAPSSGAPSASRRLPRSAHQPKSRPDRPTAPRRTPIDTRCTQAELRAFLVHLASERGLANNSLHAYRRDLEQIDRFLRGVGKTLVSARADEYRAYLRDQTHQGRATKTVSRRLAAIRVFLRFLASLGHDRSDVLQQLERPKPQHHLPKVLNRQQVAQLI